MNRPFVALLVALFAGGVAAAPIKVLLPAYVESALRQPPLLTSALLSIQLGCGGLFALAGGALSDLVSRRAAVLLGLTTAVFGAALFAVQAPAALVALAVLWGVAGGFQAAGGQTFLLSSVSRAHLGSATAVYFIASTGSGALGAFLAGQMADRFGFAAVTVGAAALAIVAFFLALAFLPSLGSDGTAARRAVGGWSVAGYGDLLRRGDVLAMGALRFFPTLAWGAASLAIPLLVFRHSGDKSTVGLYGTVSLLAASGAQLLTGREVDRRARRSGDPHATRRMVAPISAAILLCAAAAAALHGSLVGLFIAGTAWSMTAWSLSTTIPPLMREVGQGKDDGRVVAFCHLMWSAGMLAGTLIAGAIVDANPASPFVVAAASLAVTAAVGLRFARPSAAVVAAPVLGSRAA